MCLRVELSAKQQQRDTKQFSLMFQFNIIKFNDFSFPFPTTGYFTKA